MKRSNYLLILMLSIVMASCATYNNEASKSEEMAFEAIEQIKNMGLVVAFPTDYLKERALRQIRVTRPSVQSDIDKLRADRKEMWNNWMEVKDTFAFSKLYFIPDSILKDYTVDPNAVMVLNQEGALVKPDTELSNIYVVYKEYGGFEVMSKYRFVPNPFPNKVGPAAASQLKDLIGVQSQLKSTTRFFLEMDKRLISFDRYRVQLQKTSIDTKVIGN